MTSLSTATQTSPPARAHTNRPLSIPPPNHINASTNHTHARMWHLENYLWAGQIGGVRHACCGISLACFYAPGHHLTFVTPVHYPRDHHLAAARLVQHLAAAAHRCLIATSNRSTQAYLYTTLALCFPKQHTARTEQSVCGDKTSRRRHFSVVFSLLFVFLPPFSSTLYDGTLQPGACPRPDPRGPRTGHRPGLVLVLSLTLPSSWTLMGNSNLSLSHLPWQSCLSLRRKWRERHCRGGHTLA